MQDLPTSGTLGTSEQLLFECPRDRRAGVLIRLTETANSTASVTITITPGVSGKKTNLIYPTLAMTAQQTLTVPADSVAIYLGPGSKIHGTASSGAVSYVVHGLFFPQ